MEREMNPFFRLELTRLSGFGNDTKGGKRMRAKNKL